VKAKNKTPAKKATRKTTSRSAGTPGTKANAARKPQESRAAALTKLFLQTPEMQEFQLVAGTIANKLDPKDTVSITIDIPKQFVRLTEFLEQKLRSGSRVKPRPVAAVLNQILLNELHDQLHWLTVEPAHFSYYRDLWNQFCDEHGAPEEKISDPASAPVKGEEGPF
jgi:ATP-dependent 26S proteasome regulatory subunit